MAELVDARDLKSLDAQHRAGSSPALGISHIKSLPVHDQSIFSIKNSDCVLIVSIAPLRPEEGFLLLRCEFQTHV